MRIEQKWNVNEMKNAQRSGLRLVQCFSSYAGQTEYN